MKNLFVDMDGVLAKWNYVPLEQLYEKNYFYNLSEQENIVKTIVKISADANINVYILSAYLRDSKYALSEKNLWLDEHLPELSVSNRIFIPCGDSKRKYIGRLDSNMDYLLDDYTNNLSSWTLPIQDENDLGNGIKVLNGINGTRGRWKGPSVSADKNSDEIYLTIKEKMSEKIQYSLYVDETDKNTYQETLEDNILRERLEIENSQRIYQLQKMRMELMLKQSKDCEEQQDEENKNTRRR